MILKNLFCWKLTTLSEYHISRDYGVDGLVFFGGLIIARGLILHFKMNIGEFRIPYLLWL